MKDNYKTIDSYNKKLIKWVKVHNWNSLEKDKDLILRHLRNFTGDEAIYGSGKKLPKKA